MPDLMSPRTFTSMLYKELRRRKDGSADLVRNFGIVELIRHRDFTFMLDWVCRDGECDPQYHVVARETGAGVFCSCRGLDSGSILPYGNSLYPSEGTRETNYPCSRVFKGCVACWRGK